MDQINQEPAPSKQLSKEDEARIVQHVKDTWDFGIRDRKSDKGAWDDCIKAYNCQFDPIKDPRLMWKSNVFLPWCFDALEAWYSYMHSMLLPKDESFFALMGRQKSDDAGTEVAEKYLRHTFNVNGLSEKFGDFLRQLGIVGNSCIKVHWREETKAVTEWQDTPLLDPVTKQPVYSETGTVVTQSSAVQNTRTILNNAWFEVIPIDHFVFYPISGDFEKTTKIHETWRYIEELEALSDDGQNPYFNLDKLTKETANDELAATGSGKAAGEHYKGINIKEAWIPRVRINGRTYRNYVATVANDTTLIRFQPNPFDFGRHPFVFCSLIPVLKSLLGVGMLHKALGLQKTGNFLHNARLDEIKLQTYGQYKYMEDGAFNPYNFVVRPGGLTRVGNMENLMPLNKDLQGVQINMEEVSLLKEEFEEVTVPKIVKGQLDAGDKTATEASLADKGASGKMNTMAQRINEKVLKPLIELTYLLIYQRAQNDERIIQDIARLTQDPVETLTQDQQGRPLPQPVELTVPIEQMVQKLPKFLPLPEIDVQIVGYQNQVRKQEMAVGIANMVTQLAKTPAAQYIAWYNMGKFGCRLMTLPEDEIFVSEEQRDQIDQQNAQLQQQQMQMQQAEMQMNQAKIQDQQQAAQDYAMKEQNEAAKTQQEAQQAQFNNQMAVAQEGHKQQMDEKNFALQVAQQVHDMMMAQEQAKQAARESKKTEGEKK